MSESLGRLLLQLYSQYVLRGVRRLSFRAALLGSFAELEDVFDRLQRSPLARRLVPCGGGDRTLFFEFVATLRNSTDAFATLLHTAASSNSLVFAHSLLIALRKEQAPKVIDALDSSGKTVLHRAIIACAGLPEPREKQRHVNFWLTLAPHHALKKDRLAAGKRTALDLAKDLEFLDLLALFELEDDGKQRVEWDVALCAVHILSQRQGSSPSTAFTAPESSSSSFSINESDCEVEVEVEAEAEAKGMAAVHKAETLHSPTRLRLLAARDRAFSETKKEARRLAAIDRSRWAEAPWSVDRTAFRVERERLLKMMRGPIGERSFLSIGVGGRAAEPLFWLDRSAGRYVENADMLSSLPLDGAIDLRDSGLVLPPHLLDASSTVGEREQEQEQEQELEQDGRLSLRGPAPIKESRDERRRKRHEAVRMRRAKEDLALPPTAFVEQEERHWPPPPSTEDKTHSAYDAARQDALGRQSAKDPILTFLTYR